jgi:hypothetical protein
MNRKLAPGFAAMALLLCLAAAAAAGDWNYVVPPAGDPMEHPPLRALALWETRPANLAEHVAYRGSRRQYAQLRFGSLDSVQVAVVLDHVSDREIDLYVDSGRTRVITSQELVKGSGRTWRLPLDAAIGHDDAVKLIPRQVIFQLGRTGRTLGFAARGYVEGKVRVANRACTVRWMDGDGNGLLADPQDRIWIDLNADGQWDPLDEQFLYGPILTIGSARYAVRSDELGNRFSLDELHGTGNVKLALPPRWAKLAASVHVTLVGRDGSIAAVRGDGAEVAVPVGKYRLGMLAIALAGADGGRGWNYVFSSEIACGDEALPTKPQWHDVQQGKLLALNPLGELTLTATVSPVSRSGGNFTVQPGLVTPDGLSVRSVYHGEAMSGHEPDSPAVQIELATASGNIVERYSSGFS